jgi:regulator of RNase E activity RraB
MFQSKWKEEFREKEMGRMSELYIDVCVRIAEEVEKGFDTRDEMREVFLEIAEEFNISTDTVWKTYYEGYW